MGGPSAGHRQPFGSRQSWRMSAGAMSHNSPPSDEQRLGRQGEHREVPDVAGLNPVADLDRELPPQVLVFEVPEPGTLNLLAEDREGWDAAGPTRQPRHR
jgi:hypothetical protein